jgi:hypothetical protein
MNAGDALYLIGCGMVGLGVALAGPIAETIGDAWVRSWSEPERRQRDAVERRLSTFGSKQARQPSLWAWSR